MVTIVDIKKGQKQFRLLNQNFKQS